MRALAGVALARSTARMTAIRLALSIVISIERSGIAFSSRRSGLFSPRVTCYVTRSVVILRDIGCHVINSIAKREIQQFNAVIAEEDFFLPISGRRKIALLIAVGMFFLLVSQQ
jgi:hypothetical protein